jgi:hypothetical protein
MPSVRLGSQTPRLSNVPQGVRSDGPDAVELAALCGLFLDPWQQVVLNGLLQRDAAGQWMTRDGLVVVPRQNGKGAILEAWELARLFLLGEQEVLHTAHHDRTVRDGFKKMNARIQSSPVLSDRLMQDRSRGVRVANGQRSITFNTGQTLMYATRSSGAGRGQTLDAVVLDEVQHLDDDELESLSSTIATKPFGQTLMAGSAPIPGKSAPERRFVAAGRAGSRELTYFEWSLDENERHDLDDPDLWAQANPGYGYRLFEGPFRSDRMKLTEEGFAREHLGIVEVEDGGVLPAGAWEKLIRPDALITGRPMFAVEVSEDRDWSCIAAAGASADGVHVESGAYNPGTAWVVPRARELAAKTVGAGFVVRPSAPAGSLIAELELAGLTVIKASGTDYAQACGDFYDAVAAAELTHLGQKEVDIAVRGAKKRAAGDAFVWDWRRSGLDISPFAAVTLAHWGHAVHGAVDLWGGVF